MKTLSRKHLYLLSALTSMLLWAGWPARGFPPLLLIAFCPLLLVEHYHKPTANSQRSTASFFGYAYFSMLLWNALTTWWVCNSTYVGGILAIVCNSFFMALVLTLFHFTKRKRGALTGYASLPIYWLAFEYIHLNWQLSWPWLTLGFGFSNYVALLQWYQYTGPLGGSLWIWLCNIAIFILIDLKWINKGTNYKVPLKYLVAAFAIIILPVGFSVIKYYSNPVKTTGKPVNVVVVQPNIDPYNEKFSGNFQEQLSKMFSLADTKVDSTTSYLVFPETALTDSEIWENSFQDNTSIRLVWAYLKKHPHLSLVTGAETYKAYIHNEKPPESARKFDAQDGYYDAYNTALQLDSSTTIQVYHKSKLVPGVEFMPFAKYLAPLAKLAFDLGGTSGTLGTQKEPSVFYSAYSKTTIAPAICYESIYGGYLGKYIQKGAQLIFIITNDGWWQNTPGYKQHLCYGAMLAAETGKQVVQCANTGISAIMDEKGDILQRTNWWEPAVLEASLIPNDNKTLYDEYGDYLGLYSSVLSVLLLCFLLANIVLYSIKRK
jgi:apolipoprotein N-acyltransferase